MQISSFCEAQCCVCVCVCGGGGGVGSKDELKAYQKIIMSSSVLCKNYFEGFLSYPTFFFTSIVVI